MGGTQHKTRFEFSAEGARGDSPGQRPGLAVINTDLALKGRNMSLAEVNLELSKCPLVTAFQASKFLVDWRPRPLAWAFTYPPVGRN
jgi:hypothetical protein